MSDERKPVICPCGEEMILCCDQADCGNYYAQYDCDCGWSSPQCERRTEQEAIEAAYEAATRKPPNRPLTLPELFDLGDDDVVWTVFENGRIWAMGARGAQAWLTDEHYLLFARKPTPADIEAARKERND